MVKDKLTDSAGGLTSAKRPSVKFQWGLRSAHPACVESLLHKNIRQLPKIVKFCLIYPRKISLKKSRNR